MRPKKISIGMVAAEMGISPATLYKIFKNKANLMAYVIVQYYKPFAEKAQKIVDSDMSIAENCARWPNTTCASPAKAIKKSQPFTISPRRTRCGRSMKRNRRAKQTMQAYR